MNNEVLVVVVVEDEDAWLDAWLDAQDRDETPDWNDEELISSSF